MTTNTNADLIAEARIQAKLRMSSRQGDEKNIASFLTRLAAALEAADQDRALDTEGTRHLIDERDALASVVEKVRELIDSPKDAHYPIVERAEVRRILNGKKSPEGLDVLATDEEMQDYRLREVKAEVWSECARTAHLEDGEAYCNPNPYRDEGQP